MEPQSDNPDEDGAMASSSALLSAFSKNGDLVEGPARPRARACFAR